MVTTRGLFYTVILFLGLTLAIGVFGGCGTKNPAASDDTNLAPDASGKSADADDPSYISSITVPEDTNDDQLSGLAKITSNEAEAAALAKVSGTLIKTELDNENGNVVYSVEIDTGSGTVDVKVDAGNGKILHTEADGAEDMEENDKGEEDEPGGLESNHDFEGEEEGEH